MTTSAARIGEELLREVARAADGRAPIADVWRRVGDAAHRHGLTRPSYERVLQLVHARRARVPRPATGEVVLDMLFRARSPEALLDHLAGTDRG